ncbi:MAG: mechanosensitive ion channel [Paucimonas sp.]|jgi:small-conductance mechanosensitive channel|nr:mechanosensitive ion channel [Paucimonas sp.]
MNPAPILLPELWADLRSPDFLWQVGTLVLCVIVGWALARIFQRRLAGRELQARVLRLGAESFARVLPPFMILLMIVIARPMLAQWHHVSLLKFAIPLVGSFGLIRLTFYMLRRVFARGGHAGVFILNFERVFATLVWIGFVLHIAGLWPEIIQYLDETVIPTGRYKTSLLTILQAGLSVAVTLILALWAGALLEERLMRLDAMHSSLRVVMARVGKAVLILVAVLASLSLVGIDLTVLSVFGGALGVGIGLGLQRIFSSYVSGFVILIERSLSIGDVVAVDKYQGTVTHINARYTVLQAPDGVETVVPNDVLISNPVQNYSLSNRSLRLMTQVTIGYDHDPDAVLPALQQAVASVPRVSAKPPPHVALARFGPDGLELEVGFWIADPENGKLGAISQVNHEIWRTLKTMNVSIPYQQREIRIVERQDV